MGWERTEGGKLPPDHMGREGSVELLFMGYYFFGILIMFFEKK